MMQSNLPLQLTSFIGREKEIADLKLLLLNAHIITLTGPGGSGKTRLSIQIANEVRELYKDGVWMVDLAPVNDPELIPQVILLSFGLRPTTDQPLLEILLNFVRSKKILLILDNCEHLLESCAQLCQELLCQVPELCILATSRESLAITGELIYPISGLTLPNMNIEIEKDTRSLIHYDAIQLFVERAQAIIPDFNLNAENGKIITEICTRLDGLPLALELASARINVFTIQEIETRLNDRFSLLISTHRRGLKSRHSTLRTTIDWSYTLLSFNEQTLLNRLAVFSGGWTFDVCEQVCLGNGIKKENILELLTSLVDKSFIIVETSGRTIARYRYLETIREYAIEKLVEGGESALLCDRHLDIFLARAEEAAPKLGESYQQLWLNWLEGERDNLRGALSWSLQNGPGSQHIEKGLRIANALVRFWEIRGSVQEAMTWFERLLAQTDERISSVVRVNTLVFASFLAMFLGKQQEAFDYGEKAVKLAEEIIPENKPVLTFALAGFASGAKAVGDHLTSFKVGERVVKMLRETTENSFYLGMGLLGQGEIAIQLGYYDIARERLDECLDLALRDGDAFRIAHTLNFLGDLSRCEQSYPEAQNSYEKSAVLLRELGAQHDLASILFNLGFTYLNQDEIKKSQTLFKESMTIHLSQQNKPGMIECLIGFAACAVKSGLFRSGIRLFAASMAISGQKDISRWLTTQKEVEKYFGIAQSKLLKKELQDEQLAGRIMSLEQAIAYAMNLQLKPRFEEPDKEEVESLTTREFEIASLIGMGKSNLEIAAELILSKRTIETHVSHILAKLGFSNRAQIMRWAIDHQLK
ncbi:MAG: LuxR C-terminal-related transcriptional regulator [Anaerolineaceae bacterium]|nr:LuxR C-terminal-related transcriptional regulator [Anaerolineaceae bacterium]